MSDKKLTKFAFRGYDQLPFILGTETDGKRDKDGTVSVPSYGTNARVKPLKLMDAKEGRELLNRIKGLNAIRKAACGAAYRLFKSDVLDAAPFMKKVIK
jgi:hypothetical protein